MPKDIITVNNLIKKYNKAEKNAVDNISFEVHEGEFFSLLGPNGAGKTTTISILTTTLAKTSGDLIVTGHNVDSHPSEVRQNIGVIFQNPSLDNNLTAEENIRFHAVLYGLYPFSPSYRLMPKTYKDRVNELTDILGINEEMFSPVKTFSGGMKRKLEIVRSLIHKPKVLFLDEPTSGLDPISRKNLWSYLKHVRENENTTIFLTTHYLEEAEDADRICIIDQGKVVRLETPTQLKKQLIKNQLIITTDKEDELEAEIKKLELEYIRGKEFTINLAERNTHETIKSIETPLSSIDIHSPTLEEAYLGIISEETEEQS